MRAESFDLMELLKLLSRNRARIISAVGISLVVAGMLTYLLPKEYRSRAVLSIQAGYFQGPLGQDTLSSLADPRELQSQKLALLQRALNRKFLDELGERYKVVTAPVGSIDRVRQRERLSEKIEYFALSPTTFKVSVGASDARTAQQMSREVVIQMMATLFHERYQQLMGTRDAIDEHLRSLAEGLRARGNLPLISDSSPDLHHELQKLETNIAALLVKFTERHPAVVDLRRKAQGIRRLLDQAGAATTTAASSNKNSKTTPPAPYSAEASQSVLGDLVRKLSFLNIALALERDESNLPFMGIVEEPTFPTKAVFPRVEVFLLIGLFIGMLLSVLLIMVAELKRSRVLAGQDIAQELGLPYFGELPRRLTATINPTRLSAPQHMASSRSLPAPGAEASGADAPEAA